MESHSEQQDKKTSNNRNKERSKVDHEERGHDITGGGIFRDQEIEKRQVKD